MAASDFVEAPRRVAPQPLEVILCKGISRPVARMKDFFAILSRAPLSLILSTAVRYGCGVHFASTQAVSRSFRPKAAAGIGGGERDTAARFETLFEHWNCSPRGRTNPRETARHPA